MTDTTQAPPRGRVRVEPGAKRVRALLGGQTVVDTLHPSLVWEIPYYPAYYLPRADVRAQLEPTGAIEHSPSRGDAVVYDVRIGDRVAEGAALAYPESPIPELRDLVRFQWGAMDEWLEEDEPVYVHPRSPYTRVDILASTRRVQVSVDGVELADSSHPHILFETGLPPRYYLPLADLRTELLVPSDTHEPMPLQGHGVVLVGAGRGHALRRLRLDLPQPAPRERQDHGAGLLLQREGRPRHRRRAPGAPSHPLLLTAGSTARPLGRADARHFGSARATA